jgi:signal transduction histidine kinase
MLAARPESNRLLETAVSRLRWAVLAALLLISQLWPIVSRTGHPIWLFLLVFAGYNLLIELLRKRVTGFRFHTWIPLGDLLIAAILYYFDAEPVGPIFVLFCLAVISAAISLTPPSSLLYTTAVIVTVAAIAPTLPLWSPDNFTLRHFALRLSVLGVVGIGATFLIERLVAEGETARAMRDEAARLRELDRLRANFIASISHDLRTPLTSARVALGMLKASADDRHQSDERELLDIARRNIERLTIYVNDLVTVNQLKAGVLQLKREPLDLRIVAADAIAAIHPLIREKGQPLEADLPEPLPIEGDARRLEQALVNLLDNAHYHTPAGTRIAVSGRATAAEATLSVSDDGPGIPADALERIFERFHRLDAAEGGSGIGLAAAKGIVELHGGRIWAESAPGRGATFHFALPCRQRGEGEGW